MKKTNWSNGDVITAEKLNKIENGVANADGTGVLVVHVDSSNPTMDKTWQEITNALDAGMVVTMPGNGTFSFIVRSWIYNSVYMLSVMYTSDGGL